MIMTKFLQTGCWMSILYFGRRSNSFPGLEAKIYKISKGSTSSIAEKCFIWMETGVKTLDLSTIVNVNCQPLNVFQSKSSRSFDTCMQIIWRLWKKIELRPWIKHNSMEWGGQRDEWPNPTSMLICSFLFNSTYFFRL